MQIDWDSIDIVFLDLDGTLIDRHYEDYFWETIVPKMYAKKHVLKVSDSRKELLLFYKKHEGTKNWGDIGFMEKSLGMKLLKTRFEMRHMIKLHPHTVRFLKFLKKHKKKVYMISACPHKEMKFKVKITGISDYFDGYYSEADFGESKYAITFWKKLAKNLSFDKDRTLMADDMTGVLKAAKAYGIRHLLFKSKNSSKKPARDSNEFIYVHHFDDVLKA